MTTQTPAYSEQGHCSLSECIVQPLPYKCPSCQDTQIRFRDNLHYMTLYISLVLTPHWENSATGLLTVAKRLRLELGTKCYLHPALVCYHCLTLSTEE